MIFESKYNIGDTVYELYPFHSFAQRPYIETHVVEAVIFRRGEILYGFGKPTWDSEFLETAYEEDLFADMETALEKWETLKSLSKEKEKKNVL